MQERMTDSRLISEIVKDKDVVHVALHIPDRTLDRVLAQVEEGDYAMLTNSDIRVTTPSGREFIGHFVRYDGEGKKVVWDRNGETMFNKRTPVPEKIHNARGVIVRNPTYTPMDLGDSSDSFGTPLI